MRQSEGVVLRTMKATWKIKFCLIATVLFATSVNAKDWRGIVPLKSTRADVEQQFGKPTRTDRSSSYYNLSQEIVVFHFQTEPCDIFGLGWNVLQDTVTDIGIIPKGIHRRSEYQLALSSRVEDNGAGLVYYSDNDAGLMVETNNELVTLVSYYPRPDEAQLRCPRTQTCCVDPRSLFDEYGEIAFADEKARLDNFLLQMNRFLYRGVLEVRGPSPKHRAQQLKRAVRGKDYLVKQRRLEPERLLIVNGGFSQFPLARLSLYPIGGMHAIYLFPEKDPKPTVR